jgi:hypothetical protein
MKTTYFWLTEVATVLGASALLFLLVTVFWLNREKPKPREQAPAAAAAPGIHYPIESDKAAAEPLPPLSDSDGVMRYALAKLFGKELQKFFNSHDIVHRIVATIDNLPRDNIPLALLPVRPVPGLLVTTKAGEHLTLSSQNSARYRPYVRLAELVPTAALVTVYKRFYPLFQQQYENLGYPDKYFNDRVVEVIDHLLETPNLDSPARLSQPGVLYEFADPRLEKLSAGQKILLRMGPENARAIKTKLREIRKSLASNEAND